MKRLVMFALLALQLPLFMQAQEDSRWCGLDDAFYVATTCVGRNDYFYLVQNNHLWYLKKKLSRQEDIYNLDKYYIYYAMSFNGRNASVFRTPLQQAVDEGNLKVVKLLCQTGVSIVGKIKNASQMTSDDLANVSYTYLSGRITGPSKPGYDDKFIDDIALKYGVGLSAVEFARKKITDAPVASESDAKKNERAAILSYLEDLIEHPIILELTAKEE